MHRLALGVIKVDGCALVVVALNLRQVHSQVVTQLTEFGLPGDIILLSILFPLLCQTSYKTLLTKSFITSYKTLLVYC